MIEPWQLAVWLALILAAIVVSGVLMVKAHRRRKAIRAKLNRPMDEIGLRP